MQQCIPAASFQVVAHRPCGVVSGAAIDRIETLGTIVAVHALVRFAIPRPRALLGDENLRRIAALLRGVIGRSAANWITFRLSAAGSSSPVLRRLRSAIAEITGCSETTAEPSLHLRLWPDAHGWCLAARTTPLPLTVRPWRGAHLPGALDASVARAILLLGGHHARQRVLNIACGAATLLIERRAIGPWRAGVGVDIDARAIDAARQNLASASVQGHLIRGDLEALPFPDASFDAVVADPPFGMLNSATEGTYPALIDEALRVVSPDGYVAIVSARRRLLDACLQRRTDVRSVRPPLTCAIPLRNGTILLTIRFFGRRRGEPARRGRPNVGLP